MNMALNTNKELKLYYSISEVAEMFDVNESLLRFTRFDLRKFLLPKT
jgi:transposase-like protein